MFTLNVRKTPSQCTGTASGPVAGLQVTVPASGTATTRHWHDDHALSLAVMIMILMIDLWKIPLSLAVSSWY